MVFAAIFAGIILVAGISWKILAPAFLFVAAVAVGIVALVASPEGQKFLESTERLIKWQLELFQVSEVRLSGNHL